MKIAVVSPHRDDACFSLALAVGSWLAAGHKVQVVNCFSRSEEAPYSDAGSVHAKDRLSFVTALRGREDEAWRRRYRGNLTIADLNLKDAPLRLHCPPDHVATAVELTAKAAGKIRKALEGTRAVVLPLGLGGHVDHRTARDAGIEHARGAGAAVGFYEDLPDAAGMEDGAIEAAVRTVEERLGEALTARFAAGVEDAAEARVRKLRLALFYDSQINDEVAERIAGFCERYGGRERIWGNAGWVASGVCTA